MNKKNRVFMVSGTMPAMVVLSIIEEDKANGETYNNYAFITSLSVAKNANQNIVGVIYELLRSGDFVRIEDITDIDETVITLMENDRTIECEDLIRQRLALDKVHELFMVDNSNHKTLVMTGRVFDDAHIVCYGDGTGYIYAGLGFGFCHLDEIRTFLPVDMYKGFCERLPLRIIDKNAFISVCRQFHAKNERFRNALESLRRLLPENPTLLTTAPFSEWRMMDLDKEINMYAKAVYKSCKQGDTILIKRHPRDTSEKKSDILADALTQKGFKVIYIKDDILMLAPVELICNFISFEKGVCVSSTSAISLKYFFGMDTYADIDEEDLNNFKRGVLAFELEMEAIRQAHKNLDTWDMNGPLYSFEKSPFSYYVSAGNVSYTTYEEVYYNILTNFYMKKRRLWEFFTEKNIKSVAIYGMTVVGKLIAEDLLDNKELNVCLLDRSLCGQTFMGKEIQFTDTADIQVDCAIITLTHSLDEVGRIIKRDMGCDVIYSLKDL